MLGDCGGCCCAHAVPPKASASSAADMDRCMVLCMDSPLCSRFSCPAENRSGPTAALLRSSARQFSHAVERTRMPDPAAPTKHMDLSATSRAARNSADSGDHVAGRPLGVTGAKRRSRRIGSMMESTLAAVPWAYHYRRRDIFAPRLPIRDGIVPRHIVCLTFDFDTMSGFIARGLTTPTPLSRGEFGARASTRILDFLERRGIRSTWFTPGFTIEILSPRMRGGGEGGPRDRPSQLGPCAARRPEPRGRGSRSRARQRGHPSPDRPARRAAIVRRPGI